MNRSIISSVAIFFITSCLISCKKPSTSSTLPGINAATIVQQGNWRVTLYNDKGTDETFHFSGYVFTFKSNGTITGAKGTSTASGTWANGMDNGQSKLIINFGTTVPFNKLNNDWHIVNQTATKIIMNDVSGGGGGTDLLTFEKN